MKTTNESKSQLFRLGIQKEQKRRKSLVNYREAALEEAQEKFDRGDHYFDGDVIRWKLSNNPPMSDMMIRWLTLGLVSDDVFNATEKTRAEENSVAIAQYVDAQNSMSQEQRDEVTADMRAAFGPGETVVNVFTGRITKT